MCFDATFRLLPCASAAAPAVAASANAEFTKMVTEKAEALASAPPAAIWGDQSDDALDLEAELHCI
jgi:hypothetical protein